VFRFALAIGITIAFAILARLVQGVSASGALAGAVICFLLFITAGPAAVASLTAVFILAWLTTRLGYSRKIRLGTAERRGGRTASQVVANLGVAAACAPVGVWLENTALLVACAAALAEAAADTVSSEIGQAYSESARLITSWRQVPAGTNGGITLAGTLAGVIAATIVTGVSVLGGLVPKTGFAMAAFSAMAGMFVDSYLGAWFEQRRKLNNNAVNLLSTLATAVLAGILWILASPRF
jgi:uncharacterized protein (TIGR00297 family)